MSIHGERDKGFWIAFAALLGLLLVLGFALSGCAASSLPKVVEVYEGHTSDHLGQPYVMVDGAVAKRGLVPWFKGMTAHLAVVVAGGTRDEAEETHVLLRRGDQLMTLDLKAVRLGREGDPLLIPGDLIFVDTNPLWKMGSPFRHLLGFGLQAAQLAVK